MKLALFTQKPTEFYTKIFFGMRRGFEALGHQVEGMPMLLPDSVLATYCREVKPDVVLEMDRTRRQVPSLPREIPHISWIVDYVNPFCDSFYGSDLLYFFGKNWLDHHDIAEFGAGLVDWLPPGTCPTQYYYEEQPWECDFSFVGHMPNPWTEAEKSRQVGVRDGRPVLFEEALAIFKNRVLETVDPPFSYIERINREAYDRAFRQAVAETGCVWENLSQSLQYDITIRVRRMHNRQRFLDHVFELSDNIRFYGTGGWSQWPRYAPHFHGYQADTDVVRRIFQTTRINLHDGVPGHFRLFDCLAAGGFLFCRHPMQPMDRVGIGDILQPGKHFILVRDDNFATTARFWLDHPEERRHFTRQAAQEIARHHTWQARAQRILEDLARL